MGFSEEKANALLTPLYDMERGFRDFWEGLGVGRGILQDATRELAYMAWIESRAQYQVRGTPEPAPSPCAAIPLLRLSVLRELLLEASLSDYNLAKHIREEIAREEQRLGGSPPEGDYTTSEEGQP